MARKFLTPVKVGLLTTVALIALLVGVLFVTKGRLTAGDSYPVHATFRDASGLRGKTRVQIAGIEVGQIEGITLVGNEARVALRIREDIVLYSDASIAKRTEGFIGDMTLDINPGHEPPRIPPGGEIRNVIDAGSIDKVFETLDDVTADIQAVTAALRDMLAGEDTQGSFQQIIDDVARLTSSVNRTIEGSATRLDTILANFEAISGSARDLATGEERTVEQILDNTEVLTRELTVATRDAQEVLASVKGILGTSEGSLKEGVAGLRQSLDKLNATLDQVNGIAQKVSTGESTMGRLLTDDRLIDDIEATVSDASDFVGRLVDLQTQVDLRSEYYFRHESSREQLVIRILPALDRWYELGLVSPVPRPEPERVTVYDAQGNRRETVRVDEDETLGLNAMFAQRWRFPGLSLTGKVGLIETKGAVAGELGLFREHLRVGLEVFEFGHRYKPYPRIRAFATWNFLNHLFLVGGVDDALNDRWELPASLAGAPEFDGAPRDFFLGGGFYFTDEDLKALITTVGIPSP